MKAYGEAELQLHVFLTMELVGDEWESRPVITTRRMATILISVYCFISSQYKFRHIITEKEYIQGVLGRIVNILGGGTMDCSE